MSFKPIYIPIGVGTFHLESAENEFNKSKELLKKLAPEITVPDEMLLSIDKLGAYLDGKTADFAVVQNLTFANAAASIITTRKGALSVMPEKAEIEELIRRS